jgi:hypothetical protein
LARYDTDYDVRDRARFLRALTIPNTQGETNPGLNQLKEHLKTILLSNKEPPVIESEIQGKYNVCLGDVSYLMLILYQVQLNIMWVHFLFWHINLFLVMSHYPISLKSNLIPVYVM